MVLESLEILDLRGDEVVEREEAIGDSLLFRKIRASDRNEREVLVIEAQAILGKSSRVSGQKEQTLRQLEEKRKKFRADMLAR